MREQAERLAAETEGYAAVVEEAGREGGKTGGFGLCPRRG